MQTCHKCQADDNPDTAIQCYRCRHPLKKRHSRFRNLSLLQASDLAALVDHVPEIGEPTNATPTAALLIGAILLFLGSFLLFLPSSSGSGKLAVSNSSINFSTPTITISQTRTFFISNTGTAPLHWKSVLPLDATWLSLRPSSGTLSGNSSQLAILSVDSTHSLPPTKSYKNFLQINSDGGTRSVNIVMNTIATTPSLSITPTNLTFHDIIQGTSKTQILHLTNTGKQALPWNVGPLPSWIALAPRHNDMLPPLQSEDLTLTVDTSQISQQSKTFSTSLTFTYDGRRAITIPVQATIAPPPARPYLCINLTNIDLGTLLVGKNGTKMLEVRNCGTGGVLRWNTTTDKSWISATPSSSPRDLLTHEIQLVALHYDTSGLRDGTYQATLMFQSNTNTQPITIQLAVHTPQPVLCNFTQNANFGTMQPDEKPTQSVGFQNCGEAPLHYQLVAPPWIHSSSSQNILDSQQAGTIQFEIDPSSLSPGSHTTTLRITSDGGEADISAIFQVIKSAELLPTQLDFGDRTQNEPASLLLPLHNNGDVPLAWHISSLGASWIDVKQQDGTIPPHGEQPIQVDATTNSLPSNQLSETKISFAYNNQTAIVPVSIHVLPPPRLCTTPDPSSMPITLQQQQSTTTSFQVYNCGGEGLLTWDILPFLLRSIDNQGDFTSHASVYKQGDNIVAITIDTRSIGGTSLLPVGSYTLTIPFSDQNNSFVDIPVTITPAPSPCIQAPPSNPITVRSGQFMVIAIPIYNCGSSNGTTDWSMPTTTIAPENRISIHNFTSATTLRRYDDGIGITVDTGGHGATALPIGSYQLDLTFGTKNFSHILTFRVIEASSIPATSTLTPPPTATPGDTPPPTATPGDTSPPTATPGDTPPPTATPGDTPPPTATPGDTPPPTATPGDTPPPTP